MLISRSSKILKLSVSNRHASVGVQEFVVTERIQKILDFVKLGKNVFVSGGAGSGKTMLINFIKKSLSNRSVVLTASTGLAASHIGGITLHSFAGLLPQKSNKDFHSSSLSFHVEKRMKECDFMVIDEISMVSSETLDIVDQIARQSRVSSLPFGGIQVMLVGDPFQLPPVNPFVKSNETTFFFEANCFKKLVQRTVELDVQFRFTDSILSDMLRKFRFGICTEAHVKILNETQHNTINNGGIMPTKLFTHVKKVENLNRSHLATLPGKPVIYYAVDSETTQKIPGNHFQLPQIVKLKMNAQVMLVKNLDNSSGLCNGACGKVVDFEKSTNFPIVQFMNGIRHTIKPVRQTIFDGVNYVSREQIPLTLAWALSIHKSQGMTVDFVSVDLKDTFEFGQAYVALSRSRSLRKMCVHNFEPKHVMCNPKVLEFYKSIFISKQFSL